MKKLKFKEVLDKIDVAPSADAEVDTIISNVFDEMYQKASYYYNTKASDSETYAALKKRDDSFKAEIIFRIFGFLDALSNSRKPGSRTYNEEDNKNFEFYYNHSVVLCNFMDSILKSKLALSEKQIILLLEKLNSESNYPYAIPVNPALKQAGYYLEKNKPSAEFINLFKNLQGKPDRICSHTYKPKDKDKIKVIISELIAKFEGESGGENIPKILWSDEDSFGEAVNSEIEGLGDELKLKYYKLFGLCKKTSGGKPTRKFREDTAEVLNAIGKEEFYTRISKILSYYLDFEVQKETRSSTMHNGNVYTYDVYHNISLLNSDILKTLIWTCIPVIDDRFIILLAKTAEKAYKKIPGKGPANMGVGNACFYVLAASNSMEAVSQLSRLKLKLKQNSVLKLIDSYIEEIANESGVGKREMEDMAVQDYGLKDGSMSVPLGDYHAEIKVDPDFAVKTAWYNPEGKEIKTLPASVKNDSKAEIKKITENAKEIQKLLSANRDRLDRSYIYDREWKYGDFFKYFLHHGLMSPLAKKLIWIFSAEGKSENLFWRDGGWINFQQEKRNPSENSAVRLWHPVGQNLNEILAWRDFFLQNEIKQPFKQAFREVYILTDAELATRTYSNRMAAHIIKQHQFNTLAKGRGWSYSLLGAYDDGRDGETAKLPIPEHGLTAEFWINELFIDGAFNDAGIWNFVGTDQLRFTGANNSLLELTAVSPLIFSEVMRDADLFVGVGSVGNDPEWTDRGNLNDQHRTYWQTYSFGDLNETAKIRKSVLEKILPRLKIAKVSEIKDKFLYIRGKLRTYKIHIGSSNILMEPNDEYLCIVPDRTKSKTENYFLPFEGDPGLSAVLSKALMLAEDDKIKDETITRQIIKG